MTMTTSFITTLIIIYFSLDICYSWTRMSDTGMGGTTYAGGTIYDVNTMCVGGVNQGYACDGRNFGDKYLNPSVVSAFCNGWSAFGNSQQYGFGHGVTESQKCGECAQLRVPRLDGTYNYMTVMMVDHYTWSMEVGTTEIDNLVEGTQWQVGDRADFDYRLTDCYAPFTDDGGPTPVQAPTPTPRPVQAPVAPPTTTTTTTTTTSGGGGGGSGSGCRVSSNWGSMTMSPYWGSTTRGMYIIISNPRRAKFDSFEVKGYGQSDSQYTQCVYQNVNSWQCEFSSPLTEPASVRLDGGTYYGINIIESMTGSTAQYPSSSCSSPFTEEDSTSGDTMAATTIIAIVIACLIAIGCIIAGGVCLYKYNKKKKGSAYFEENVDTPDVDVDADAVDGDEVDTNVEVVATTQE